MTNGQLVWITGAGKGIGRAVAIKLAQDGWQVAASARTRRDLDTLEREAPAGSVVGFPLDVTDVVATRRVLDDMERKLGLPDTVILNAGTHKPTPAESFSIGNVRALMETNVMGTANGLA
jgi:NAD(P)-dependent dehydrogenase (short-subunit alcohol dehydrogenase family)